MPKFPELDASLGETLDLPVNGKVYSVPPLDAETWARFSAQFTRLSDKAAKAESDDEEVADDRNEATLYRRGLGPVYDELAKDGATWAQIRVCGKTALVWHLHGTEVAMKMWTEGGSPKPTSTSETTEPTETPAAAPSTPSPASESGTTRSRKDRASNGRTSSRAGAS